MVVHQPQSVFGFTIPSGVPFNFLRTGGGEHALQLDFAPNADLEQSGPPTFEWKLKDRGGEISARLYQSDGMYHFWTSDVGWYRIDPVRRSITAPNTGDEVRRELRLWGVPTMLCFTERGDVPLHASAVQIGDGAVLFAAPGQFGKTTLALAFHLRGYRILTEDLACCRLLPHPALVPGPASLRLRPDMFDGHAPAGMTIVSVKPDRAFLALDSDRRGDCRPIPIRAVLFLRRSNGEVVIERVDSARAIPDLWTLSFRLKGREALGGLFGSLTKLAAAAPVWNLHRPLRMDVMDEVVSRVVEACSTDSRPRQ